MTADIPHGCSYAAAYRVEDRGHATPCWIWRFGRASNGYGITGPRCDRKQTHRAYYEREHGPIPLGAHVDHLCRVRACVNPEHMEVVTCAENARRGDNAKLTYDDVEEIRRLRASGLLQREVAAMFGIVRQTVSEIERGVSWSAPGGVIPIGA